MAEKIDVRDTSGKVETWRGRGAGQTVCVVAVTMKFRMKVLMGTQDSPNTRPLIFRANRWMLYRSWSTLPK